MSLKVSVNHSSLKAGRELDWVQVCLGFPKSKASNTEKHLSERGGGRQEKEQEMEEDPESCC